MPRCRASSLMVKPRAGWAVRNEMIIAARVDAGAARAMLIKLADNLASAEILT